MVEQILDAFVIIGTPVYFIAGWWITKNNILEKRRLDSDFEVGGVLRKFIYLMSIVVIIGMLISLVMFYRISKPLISNSFEKISIGGLYSARVVWFRLVVCSFNMNVILEVIKGFSESVKKVCDTVIALLKWSVQHIMNIVSAMALYYAIYPKHSGKGNAFLITLAAFITLEWLVRDIFEKISLFLRVEEAYWFKLIYGVMKTNNGD